MRRVNIKAKNSLGNKYRQVRTEKAKQGIQEILSFEIRAVYDLGLFVLCVCFVLTEILS